ncbi:MAG TPA: phosphoadenylyl-sulfate reductase [Flavisolibacter sp.]|jgi:phosphoadenosine phosphosulfate reductase|nr:phosphoadenylyl-sulfate reductase [Flavisolibacter sp.]
MSISLQDRLLSLQNSIQRLSITEAIQILQQAFPGAVTFSTSFSYEDQVVTDHISKSGVPVSLFTLDTGRLFPETYSTWSRTLETYQLPIKAYYPDQDQLQEFVAENGPNAFYTSVALRQQCCAIRKVVPLRKALQGNSVWITGLRAQHSPNRSDLTLLEWDETNRIIKYNPLLHWTTEEVLNYIKEHAIPYNVLHDRGFVSIGCAPCTRAIKEGEDFRAGRWWWEDASKKECGLHVHTNALSKS